MRHAADARDHRVTPAVTSRSRVASAHIAPRRKLRPRISMPLVRVRPFRLTPPKAIPILPRSFVPGLPSFLPSGRGAFHRMIPRVCGVGGALAALLTVASVCLAAEPNNGPGRGGVGGQLGGSTFRFDRMLGKGWFGDYSDGAISRFAFRANFRYVVNKWLRWQVSPGMTWSAYRGDARVPFEDPRFRDRFKGKYIALLLPVSAEAQYVIRRGWWLYYAGAGPGIYRVWVENRREVVKDPETLLIHRGLYPGVSGELGVEYFLKQLPSTSVELSVGGDLAFAVRNEQFVSGFNSNVLAVGARIGGNYYFSPGEKKKK